MFPKRFVTMIDDSEKRNRQLAFELQNSHVCEKRSNESMGLFIFNSLCECLGYPLVQVLLPSIT